MKHTLWEYIEKARKGGYAIGHFNVSNLEMLKGIVNVARELKRPIIIGLSEGEREFVGLEQARALVDSYEANIFLNADHTRSFQGVKEAVKAGFDAILADNSRLPLAKNIKETKKAVEYIKSKNPDILVEGEVGYIGEGSQIKSKKEITSSPFGTPRNDGSSVIARHEAISSSLRGTKQSHRHSSLRAERSGAWQSLEVVDVEKAREFIKGTKVDLLAPAVGSMHGIIKGWRPKLDYERISTLSSPSFIPLVLHGASGLTDNQVKKAVKAGVNIVHFSTELRLAWRKGLEQSLKQKKNELAPYRILDKPMKAVEKVVRKKINLISN